MKLGKPHAYRALKCPLENCQWYKEFVVGATTSADGLLPQVSRPNESFVEGNVSAYMLTFELGIYSNECSEGLSFDCFSV
jgi:hypothetical protein